MKAESNEQLLPCPFCGKAGEYDSSHYTGRGVGPEYSGHSVYCSSQECPYFTNCLDGSIFDTKKEAVNAWNTRTASWTAIEDGLPELNDNVPVSDEVLGMLDNDDVCIVVFHARNQEWVDHAIPRVVQVVAWMPIPPYQPKTAKENDGR